MVELFPRRISIFMVPSDCMIRTIPGSAGATGTSGWCAAPRGRITVLHSCGAATNGAADGSAGTEDAVASLFLGKL